MDVTKLPSDSIYKFAAFGGLAIVVIFVSWPVYCWDDLASRRFQLDEQRGELDVDFERWLEENTHWNNAIFLRDAAAAEIERKEAFGPTEPLTKAERENLRRQVNSIPGNHADAEHIIELQNFLRAAERESPTIEESRQLYATAKGVADRFDDNFEEHIELAARVDKAKKSVAVNEQRLEHSEFIFVWSMVLGAVGLVVGTVIASCGLGLWYWRHQIYLDQAIITQSQQSVG